MPVTSSGAITLQDIQDEFGGSHPIGINEYYGSDTVPTSGTISLDDFYGTQNAFAFTVSTQYTTPQNVQSVALAAGWDGSKPIVMTIASNSGFHSNSVSSPALNVNVDNTVIINNGWIAGKGDRNQNGGDALDINANSVSVTNNSGAFIAGAGGAGVGSQGGGGAGQSTIGTASPNGSTTGYIYFGGGSTANVYWSGCGISGTVVGGTGGPQGGGGVTGTSWVSGGCSSPSYFVSTGAYAGPRAQNGGGPVNNNPALGGSVLDASSNVDGSGSNGGGGWGRDGKGGGYSAGKAIEDNGKSYSLTNNGTIYGATT